MDHFQTCPEPRELERLTRGQLSDSESERLSMHVLACTSCALRLDSLLAKDPLLPILHGFPVRPPDSRFVQDMVEKLVDQRPTPGSFWAAADSSAEKATAVPQDVTQELYEFLAPPQGPGEIGRLGDYRIRQVLGMGGMGIVFEAEDPHLERPVAVKTLKPKLAVSASARRRFLREARAAAALTHDHIVTIYQTGTAGGVPFLAMQLLQGESLDQRLEQCGTLPAAEVIRIGREVAEGLAAAHARGLIHRDIKPANIWLERKDKGGKKKDGTDHPLRPGSPFRVKILDFGLVRALQDVEDEDAGTDHTMEPSHSLTQTGVVMGTPAYVAPEQARGEAVNASSDLFSLGCVLYRACIGVVPFAGADLLTTLQAAERNQPLSPRQLNARIPEALSDLIMKLLAKRPADRPASASVVAETLERISPAQPHAFKLKRQSWAWRGLATAIFLGLLALSARAILSDPTRYSSTAKDDTDQSNLPATAPRLAASSIPCNFAPQVSYPVGFRPLYVAAGDFNGDGNLDLAVSNMHGDSVSVLLGNGDGTFRPALEFPAGIEPHSIVAADFNGDGKIDLAVANPASDTVSVLPGNGDGSFLAPVPFATGPRPRGLAVADLNCDGKADLLVAHHTSLLGRHVSVLLGKGDGSFQPAAYSDGGEACNAAAVADFNGDGIQDVVVANGVANTVNVLLGKGDGTFHAPVSYKVGSGPGVVVVGDFDGDGRLDLATENVGSNDVSVLLGKGDGTFSAAVSYTTDANAPGGLALADFNGDGVPDLAVANHDSPFISLLLGNGDGTFRPAQHFPVGWTPVGIAVGDFNGDHRPDLAVVNHESNSVSVLLGSPPVPHFRLRTPAETRTGDEFEVHIEARSVDSTLDVGYTGSILYTSSDPKARFSPDTGVVRQQDGGLVRTLHFLKLQTVGPQTVMVSDQANPPRRGTATVVVLPGLATHFRVSPPIHVNVGEDFFLRVTALDARENIACRHSRRMHFSCNDSRAVLPADCFLEDAFRGVQSFRAGMKTPGRWTITVTDVEDRSITGTATVDVHDGAGSKEKP
jgi:serine/threonine protein kinase